MVDIFTLIFQEILQISPRLISQYSTLQDQLLYLILVPHVVLFLFIIAFSRGIVSRVIGDHPGFNYLFSITAYLVIVLAGWYGTFLVPLLITWFYIGLILAFILFGITLVINPSRTEPIMKFFEQTGKLAGKGSAEAQEREFLEKEIAKIDHQLRDARNKLRRIHDLESPAYDYASMKVLELEEKKSELEAELHNM